MRVHLTVSSIITPAALDSYIKRINHLPDGELRQHISKVTMKYKDYLPILAREAHDSSAYAAAVGFMCTFFELLDEKLNEFNSKGN
jgi:hypothetical protein